MNAKMETAVFYVCFMFLLISACLGTSSATGGEATSIPLSSVTSTTESIVVSAPSATPVAAPGSLADFQIFAAEIDAALQAKDTSFFEEHAASSTWTCLGDETFGVCKDQQADMTLEGMPVAYDWGKYEVSSREDYKAIWQTTFDNHSVVKLAAVAQQFGDNPFMSMATQSALAIIRVADEDDPAFTQEARVLFFEYLMNTWYLRGELVTVEQAEAWLTNMCEMCYDTWVAWPE